MDKPEFLDRIQNPNDYPYITNKDGSISTHKMSAEVDENGNWYVFPTIVKMPTGELYEFNDPVSYTHLTLPTKRIV